MIEVKEGKLQRADAHHKFTYEYGKKTEKEDSGIIYLYKDKYGLLHATSWEDIAAGYGKYIATDEIEQEEGLPFVNGSAYTIFGAGEDYVYLTKNKTVDSKFHTVSRTEGKATTAVYSGKELKRASCELLRQLYDILDTHSESVLSDN